MNFDDFLDETARIDDRADLQAGEEPPEGYITPAAEQAAWDGATFHADGVCDCPEGSWNTGEMPF